jgi:hypothetical protein
MSLRRAAAAVCAGALTTIVISAGAPAATADATPLGTLSIPCGPPPITAEANFSWEPGGSSTTVYYNNHCNKGKTITVYYMNGDFVDTYECLTAPPWTKGKEKFEYGAIGKFKTVRKGCP